MKKGLVMAARQMGEKKSGEGGNYVEIMGIILRANMKWGIFVLLDLSLCVLMFLVFPRFLGGRVIHIINICSHCEGR